MLELVWFHMHAEQVGGIMYCEWRPLRICLQDAAVHTSPVCSVCLPLNMALKSDGAGALAKVDKLQGYKLQQHYKHTR